MKVKLLAYTPNPEKVVAAAAKLCYSKADIETIMDGLTDEKVTKFLNSLAERGHMSPFEHASFTFGIEDVSRCFLAQMSRHRIASFSVQSQRYVHDNFGAVVPESIKENAGCNDIYKQTIEALYNIYDGLTETLQNQYISDGMDAKAAEKKATEDARYILPNAACTKMIVTMNARELMHFFNLRCCNHAQWEIRAVADEMLRQVKKVAPTIFKNAGAPCVSGPCPEGKFSCGHPRKAGE